jgi:hypothetical protein
MPHGSQLGLASEACEVRFVGTSEVVRALLESGFCMLGLGLSETCAAGHLTQVCIGLSTGCGHFTKGVL